MIRILPTIGPSSEDNDSISSFAINTKLFRLNGSHGNMDWHLSTIAKIRKFCPDAFILMDIPGIKPRTSNSTNIKIKKGQYVLFGDNYLKDYLNIKLTKPLPEYNNLLKNFSINDGQFVFDVTEHHKDFIVGCSRSFK